jgi:hypothetical protein
MLLAGVSTRLCAGSPPPSITKEETKKESKEEMCLGTFHYIKSIEASSDEAMAKLRAFVPSLAYMGPNDNLSKLHPADAMRYHNLASEVYKDMTLMFAATDSWEAACSDASPEKLAEGKNSRRASLKQFRYGLDQILNVPDSNSQSKPQ